MTYTTAEGDERWPWTGVTVTGSLTDWVWGSVAVASKRVVAGSQLQDVADARMPGLAMSSRSSLCVADFSGDGLLDVFVAVVSGANQLWVRPSAAVSSYVDMAGILRVAGGSATRSLGCAVADVDGDAASLELFVGTNSGDPNELYVQPVGGGTYRDEATLRGLGIDAVTEGASWGDVDGELAGGRCYVLGCCCRCLC